MMASAHVFAAAPDLSGDEATAALSPFDEAAALFNTDELPPTLSFSLTRTETAQSYGEYATVGSASGVLDVGALSSAQVHDTFLSAEHFVAVVLSRLRKDAMAVDPRLWALQEHENRLWALKQQALLGSCDTSRGSKEYLQALDTDDAASGGSFLWRPCCFRMLGESKIKLWQNLGDMPHEQAKSWYIHIVTDICPEWHNPLRNDSALLRTWTPDDESDQCAICAEVFTFLNRRHHCRRCLNLVCAVCSSHTAPLRVFTETATPKRQRICSTCFHEMGGSVQSARSSVLSSKQSHVRESDYATASVDDDVDSSSGSGHALLNVKAPHTHASVRMNRNGSSRTENDAGNIAATAISTLTSTSTLMPVAAPLPFLSSSTIHCGTLEFFHGSGFRKSWHEYFFVLLLRKGSLGMFLHAQDHVEQKKRPAAVFKLSGYAVRVKSQKRRPHQLRATHPTKKALQFAARSIEDMNAWMSQLIKAIEVANELEALAPLHMARLPRRGSATSSLASFSSTSSSLLRENDFAEHDLDSGDDIGVDSGGDIDASSGETARRADGALSHVGDADSKAHV